MAKMVFVPTVPWPEEQVRAFIADAVFEGKPGFRLGIALPDGTLIGTIGLSAACEVYYFLAPAYWRKGYGSEALQVFVAACFARFDLDEISAKVFTDNPISGQMLVSLGFAQTGDGMHTSGARVEPAPISLYRLTRSAFEARHEIS